jgi:hypothetical protein
MDRRIETSFRRDTKKIGRNEIVELKLDNVITKMKYKKAQKFINNGWEII